MTDFLIPSPLQEIIYRDCHVFVKRDDLIHTMISGNKYRKLIGNVSYLEHLEFDKILTFGGAYSNHIYATAAAGALFEFETVGIIRGDELNEFSTPTLQYATKCGMDLEFWPRSKYKLKENVSILAEIKNKYPNHFIIPEGGSNMFSSEGVEEMVDEILEQTFKQPDYICSAVGTGGTVTGILSNKNYSNKTIGFSSIKNPVELTKSIKRNYLGDDFDAHFIMEDRFHFGGYAKKTKELIDFIDVFEKTYQIPLDEIYVSKMFFGIFRLIEEGFFKPSDVIVAIHTGGLQGKTLEN
jgi:1-aminocyclopropane-1-carboxylate deaminase